MGRPLTAEQAADSLVAWAMSDSSVELDRDEVLVALEGDWLVSKRYPTEEECEEMVTGGDDGEVDPDLQETFPATDALVASYWE